MHEYRFFTYPLLSTKVYSIVFSIIFERSNQKKSIKYSFEYSMLMQTLSLTNAKDCASVLFILVFSDHSYTIRTFVSDESFDRK